MALVFVFSGNALVSRAASDPGVGDVLAECGDTVVLPGGGGTLPLRTALAEGAFGAFLPQ